MIRSPSRVAVWPILLFFLVGATAAVLWDLRRRSASPQEVVPAPAPKKAAFSSPKRDRPRIAAPVRPAAKRRENPAPEPGREAVRVRKRDSVFERVGIPSARRESIAPGSSAELSEEQAQRILRRLVEARQYYGISPDCLWTRPLGYRTGGHEFEIVAADCGSIARGSVIATWRVDARTGEASFRTAQGDYEPAP